MKRSKFNQAQVAFVLRQAEEESMISKVCRKAGTSDATFYARRKKDTGLMPSEMRRLRQLEGKTPSSSRVADLIVGQGDVAG